MKLFNLMKGIFSKPAQTPEQEVAVSAYMSVDSAQQVQPRPVSRQTFTAAKVAPRPAPFPQFRQPAPQVETSPEPKTVSGPAIVVPLASLVSSFPVELQQRVKSEFVGEARIQFALDKILPQLSQGVVRVAFAEIRQSSPEAFLPGGDKDHIMVTLPLGELVSRVGATSLNRQPRRQVDVPDEIVSPFEGRGHALSLGETPQKPAQFAPPANPRGAQSAAPVPPAADQRARGNVTSIRPTTPPGTFTTFNPKPPVVPNPPQMPQDPAPVSRPPSTPTPAPRNGTNGIQFPAASQWTERNVQRPQLTSPISIPLQAVAQSCPEAVRLEIAQLGCQQAMVAFPYDQIEAGLKCGKVMFSWKQVRACITPPAPAGISAHDGMMISIPLAIVAPPFFARQKEADGGQKRVVVDEKIPNLFFGFPQPEAEATVSPQGQQTQPAQPGLPAPNPAETNYFVWDDEKEEAQLQSESDPQLQSPRPGTTPGTTFSSRKATPNEVVMKASMLEGVYGALVALPDGLLVASKLDPSQNGDAIAALIPQMYSKLSGCTKELRMGELNNLNFTVGNVPWKIFRVNGIFFAAFGCVGESLPTAHLAHLASELDYKKSQ
jgi:predicted regulator of Ras-like GTPase activity (Roadblock/LC7/MglB family)